MSPAQIETMLDLHKKWLGGKEDGKHANLAGADLAGANLAGADITDAYLRGVFLAGADLRGANLRSVNLAGADLADADLAGANLTDANLAGADLRGANLRGANLTDADLRAAKLTGATMPDGRRWEQYQEDHIAGICSEPGVIARALAAWGEHDWSSCPMHSALGIDGLDDIEDDEQRRLVACWVALYDGGHLTVDGAVRA